MVVFFAINRRLCEVFQHLWSRKGLYGVVRRRSRAEEPCAISALIHATDARACLHKKAVVMAAVLWPGPAAQYVCKTLFYR